MYKSLYAVALAGLLFFVYTTYFDIPEVSAVIIGLMGDVMLGRLVNEVMAVKGYQYPWGDMRPLLMHNQINIANLETALTTSNQIVPKVFNFKASPDVVQVLQAGYISVVNLANNHVLDFSEKGLLETIDTLDRARIQHVGAGRTLKEAQGPVIISKNGIRIGILGVTDNEPTWQATATKPGTNYCDIATHVEQLFPLIHQLRAQVDIVIMTMHWGPNMRARPSAEFISAAHALIDRGVDIIHGHSAHVPQGVEVYKNKVILYDTGDFIDDYVVDLALRNDRSFLFLVDVVKNGPRKVMMVPVLISEMQVNQAIGTDAAEARQVMQERCSALGTRAYEEGSALIIDI